jgi:endonuclease/exonuclease/phosphatase family metal-dependent hydrolase
MLSRETHLTGGVLPLWRTAALLRVFGAAVFVVQLGWPALTTGQALPKGKGSLRVMTYNLYEGADLSVAFSATSFPEFMADVTTILNDVRATNPSERAAAIARQIGKAQPTLVSLQEATQWQTCPTADFQSCAAPPTVIFDLLQLTLDTLRQQKQPYKVVTTQIANNLVAPSSTGLLVIYTQRVAILARADINQNEMQLSNIQGDRFIASFAPTILGSPLPIHRAWASADVKFHDTSFRYIATQLESFDPNINYAQAQELLTGAADTSLPVLMAMDSNSKANSPPNAFTPTYDNFIGSGFIDAWTTANPDDPGPTCCQDPLLRNTPSLVTQRIDLVLIRGELHVTAAQLFGGNQADRTPSGLWPSDHVAVAAGLRFGDEED